MRTIFFLFVTIFSFSFFISKKENTSVKVAEISNKVKPSEKGFTVLELFTSEGCSSCPSADELMQKYAARDNVFVLSYHVTYWNRLGWKDKFSQPSFDERQYNYSAKFKHDGVYTPQVVINGGYECVGSRGSEIEKQVQSTQAMSPTNTLTVSQKISDNNVEANCEVSGDITGKTLHLVLVETALSSNVKSGENSGRTLQHANVVRATQIQPLNANKNYTTHFTLDSDWKKQNCKIIAFTQDENTLKITGANQSVLR
jgi:hypothetical protein